MSDRTPTASTAVEAHLARHAARRRAGSPTVSTLAGPPGPAALAWRRWAAASGLSPAVYTSADAATLLPRSLADLAGAHDLSALALRHLHAAAGLPPPTPASATSRTSYDLDQLAAAAAVTPDPDGTTTVARALCRKGVIGDNPAAAAGSLDAALPQGTGRDAWRLLRALDGLLAVDGVPAVLFVPPLLVGEMDDPAAAADWLAAVAGPVARLAEAIPRWPVGVCAPPVALARFRAHAAPSRSKSLVLSGEVKMDLPTPADLAERLRHALVDVAGATDAAELGRAARGLAAAGATQAVADAYAAAARLRPRQDDEARSAAERFLFELLELHPRTAGRFVLNGDPGFRFGPRAAEVDLLAEGLRLAVEVDGYHHFTGGATAYRRDRRKDLELQRHGYVVVRVLAEDVVTRMDEVLDTIVRAVEHCGRRSERGGPST